MGVPRFGSTHLLLSFAIVCGLPAIAHGQLRPETATLSPNQAARGERLTISLNKPNAHFVQGETIAKFGEGIAVGDGTEGEFGRVRVLSPERASIDLIIDADADLDDRTVVIRTRTERFVLGDIFTITRRPDDLNLSPQFTLTPDRAPAGQLVTVTITGERTHFKQGLTVARFGDGVQVGGQTLGAFGPVNVISATEARARLFVDRDTYVGSRTVVLQTGDERVSKHDAFDVLPGSTQFTVTPDSGARGQRVTVLIHAPGAHFEQGSTEARFGSGIVVGDEECFGNVTVLGPTDARAELRIRPRAVVGPRSVTIRTRRERLFVRQAFRVIESVPTAPTIVSVSPNSGRQGQTVHVTITGLNTGFSQTTTQVSVGAGIPVTGLTVGNATSVTADFAIPADADPGPRTVTVTTGSENLALTNGFTVQPGIPTLTQLQPTTGKQGQTVEITVTGQFTHFAQNTTLSLGPGITISGIVVTSPTALTAQLLVARDAALGIRSLTVTTGAESAAMSNAFTVTPGTAALTTLQPTAVQQGQAVTLTVNGEFTHFGTGTVADFGSGVVVDSVNVLNANSLSARLRINRFAAAGMRTATVTTGSETVTLEDALTVALGPVITATVSPEPNTAGWHNTPVTVHFICEDPVSGVGSCEPDKVISTEGANQVISGTVVNGVGVAANTSVTLNVDRTAPTISFNSPSSAQVLFVPDITATASITDGLSGVDAATCDGTNTELAGQGIDCTVALAPGANTVTVTATDAAGNTRTASLPLTYARPPTVTITSPTNLAYLNLSPTTVTGTVDDPAATVTVNSLPAPVSNGSFSIILPIAEGPTIIAATATSPSSAAGTASITVTLDTTPPRVSITSPADGFHTTGESIAIAGIVNDIVVGTVNDEQAQVTVNGQPAVVANRTFLNSNIALAVGDNVIEAVGRDRVGNAATTRITVTRDSPTQPHITSVSGNHQTGTIGSQLSSPLVIGLADAAGNPAAGITVIFKVTQNDGTLNDGAMSAATVAVVTDSQGRAQSRWTLGHRAGAGSDIVQAYAVGFAGTAIFDASANQGPAGKIVVDSGNEQVGAIGQPLPKPFIAVVVDEGSNRLAGVPVTFTVREGGGSIDGQASTTVVTDSDGRAAATLTLGLQEGNANNIVAATFPANDGLPAGFTASGRVAGDPAATTISGLVLDNNNIPIAGVTVRAVLTSALNNNRSVIASLAAVQTDATGQFAIPGAPVGHVKLLVDGLTAQREGVYPALEYDMVTIAGQDNTVGQSIYLLPLNAANQLCVTATSGGGTLTIPEAPGFSLTVNPGQVTFPGGTQTGCVTVTVVHGDKVPMQPGFGQQPRFIVTIQPSGAVFNPPAAITLPNVDGLRPREVTEMYSFDHDIGSFVAIGTGTVSDDGLVIRSNPGVGVLKSGWHCGGQPNPSGIAAACPSCKACDGVSCTIPVAGACSDGKFCTDNDQCTNGACAGTAKPDVKGTTSELQFGLGPLFESAQQFLDTFFMPGEAPKLSLNVKLSSQDVEHCCDAKSSNVTNLDKKVAGTVGLSFSIPTPFYFAFPPAAPAVVAGVVFTLGVTGSVSVGWTDDACLNSVTGGNVTGTISLPIGGKLIIKAGLPGSGPGVVSIQGEVKGGPFAKVKGSVANHEVTIQGDWGITAIKAIGSLQFLNGTISFNYEAELVPAQSLGTSETKIPY